MAPEILLPGMKWTILLARENSGFSLPLGTFHEEEHLQLDHWQKFHTDGVKCFWNLVGSADWTKE